MKVCLRHGLKFRAHATGTNSFYLVTQEQVVTLDLRREQARRDRCQEPDGGRGALCDSRAIAGRGDEGGVACHPDFPVRLSVAVAFGDAQPGETCKIRVTHLRAVQYRSGRVAALKQLTTVSCPAKAVVPSLRSRTFARSRRDHFSICTNGMGEK